MQLGPPRRAVRAVPLALLLVACGSQNTGGGGTPSPRPTPRPDLVARLDNLPQGVARVQQAAGSRRLVAHLELSGLVPSTAHAVQLRRGTCLQRGGALIGTFADATSNASGGMSVDVTGPAVTLAGGEYLELHLVGAAQLGVDQIPIACADIPAAAPTSGARMTATPGYKPFGTVSLTYSASDRSAKLDVNLLGLVGNSQHAMQILSGTCNALGTVLHGAGDVTGDAGGTVKTTLSVGDLGGPPPATGWVLVVRSGATAAIGSTAKPTPQAQPILCGALGKP